MAYEQRSLTAPFFTSLKNVNIIVVNSVILTVKATQNKSIF